MNKEDNETLKQFKKNYDELMQDEKYQKYTSLMEFYHKKIKNLQHELEEKENIIDETIDYINKTTTFFINGEPKQLKDEISGKALLEILERGKNGK